MPVILGRDHPVTGGYPVVGVVIDAHTDDLAQLRPAQTVGLEMGLIRYRDAETVSLVGLWE